MAHYFLLVDWVWRYDAILSILQYEKHT